jgi:hypothetical protein
MVNNIFVNIGGPGWGAAIYVTARGNQILHNTFYNASPNGNQVGIYLRTGADVRNNLLLNVGASAANFIVREGGGTLEDNLCTVAAAGCALVEGAIGRLVRDAGGGDFHLVAGARARRPRGL